MTDFHNDVDSKMFYGPHHYYIQLVIFTLKWGVLQLKCNV